MSDGEIQVSPMVNMSPPLVPEQPVPVITPEQLAALLKACSGTAFADRRDLAIVRLLIDTGCRRAELTNLSTDDIDLRLRQATVTGKGRRVRTVAFGHKCAQALDRYARARAGHRDAHLPNLWLGLAGPLTDNGIAQIVRKRALDARIDERVNLAWCAGRGQRGRGGSLVSAGWRRGWHIRVSTSAYPHEGPSPGRRLV